MGTNASRVINVTSIVFWSHVWGIRSVSQRGRLSVPINHQSYHYHPKIEPRARANRGLEFSCFGSMVLIVDALDISEKVEELVPCCIRSGKSNCTTVLVSFNQSKNVSFFSYPDRISSLLSQQEQRFATTATTTRLRSPTIL